MDSDHNNIRGVEEDRLSNLPDELIHKILSFFDMKFVVQTCLLSSRWKLVWTSMPCLNFSIDHLGDLHKFSKFVRRVLTRRNREIQVSVVKLEFHGKAHRVSVRKIVNYAFSHNVQELSIVYSPKFAAYYPQRLFSSKSLKHFTMTCHYMSLYITPTTPWDFPALTTLHLSRILLFGEIFSKCVNLKNLTLESFVVRTENVFNIKTPQLSYLMLIGGRYSKVINVIAPQLENLTIIDCSIQYLNAPAGVSSLCHRGSTPMQLSENRFHSLKKATLTSLNMDVMTTNEEEDAHKTINMLLELHSVRYLTIESDIVEFISSFPDLLSLHQSPFSNLICLTIIDSSMRKDAYKLKISSQVTNFFLKNSPSATLIMELPKV